MHTVPDFYHWTVTGVSTFGILLLVWLILMLSRRAPEISTVRTFLDMVSDRGGVIVLLGGMSLYFFISAMRFFYVALDLMIEKKLDAQNAIVLMGIQFVTGTAFGGSFGAMLKTMNGNAPPPSNTTTTTTSTTTPTAPVPVSGSDPTPPQAPQTPAVTVSTTQKIGQ